MSLLSKYTAVLLSILLSFGAKTGAVSEELPTPIDPNARYVFYSHGYIVEGENPEPVHPRWGKYTFPAIKEALAEDADFHLIAHHREANTDFGRYTKKLAGQVRRLLSAGVSPGNITLMGFSRGGSLTAYTAQRLHNDQLGIILLATCNPSILEQNIKLYGRVLSIYEVSDGAGSCTPLRKNGRTYSSFEEIQINTGLEHGAFYRPIPEWIEPVKAWLDK